MPNSLLILADEVIESGGQGFHCRLIVAFWQATAVLALGCSDSRAARMAPALPAPTMMWLCKVTPDPIYRHRTLAQDQWQLEGECLNVCTWHATAVPWLDPHL